MSLTRAAQAFADALLEDDPVALYDRAPCGYLTTLPDGVVVKVNSTFLALTGLSRQEVLSRRFVDLLSAGGRIFHETHFVPLLRLQDALSEVALDLVRHDGSHLPVLLNAAVERDDLGAPRLVRIAVFEATERRRYERELVRATETARRAQADAEQAGQRLRTMVDTLQSSLVPAALPHVDGLALAGAYRPAGDGQEVGGDFYDVFESRGDLWMVLGDVSGKGVDAAVVTGLVRNGARALVLSLLEFRREPAEILRSLGEMIDHHETSRFCTAVMLRLRRTGEGWRVSYATAGHPPPVLRSATGAARFLEVTGPALGLHIEDVPHVQQECVLRSGDTLLLYSDGVTEARHRDGWYGEERLLRTVADSEDAEDLVARLLSDVLSLSANDPSDDIALVALTVS